MCIRDRNITNEYIRTKFLAERAVLEAVSSGLDGKVIRVGNLMSRNSDGEFQINFITNGFLRSLRGYEAVGKFPIGAMHEVTEFSPIDSTALAVLRLVPVSYTHLDVYKRQTVYSSFLKMQEFPLLSPQRRSRRSARSCFPGFPVRCFCLKNCWKTQMPGTRIPRLRNMIFATVFTPPVPRENQKVL